jgi:hypothetical protein
MGVMWRWMGYPLQCDESGLWKYQGRQAHKENAVSCYVKSYIDILLKEMINQERLRLQATKPPLCLTRSPFFILGSEVVSPEKHVIIVKLLIESQELLNIQSILNFQSLQRSIALPYKVLPLSPWADTGVSS